MEAKHTIGPLFTWRSAVASPQGPESPTARHVLLTLSLHMNERGESCFPSTRLLTAETALSRESVEKWLRWAVEAGWLKRAVHGVSGQGWKRYEYSPQVPENVAKEIGQLPTKVENVLGHVPDEGGQPEPQKVAKELGMSTSVSTPVPLTKVNGRRVQELVGKWVENQPIQPSQQERGKQGNAAKSICEQHTDDEIAYAVVGIERSFPYSEGEPWDLFDLRRKFPKYLALGATPEMPAEPEKRKPGRYPVSGTRCPKCGITSTADKSDTGCSLCD